MIETEWELTKQLSNRAERSSNRESELRNNGYLTDHDSKDLWLS